MDKRINNGNKGHSTKSTGLDKRKNEYKEVLNQAISEEEFCAVLNVVKEKAIMHKDLNACKLIIEYCIGKSPNQVPEIHQVQPLFPDVL